MLIGLGGVLSVALLYDLRFRRVPNWLVLAGMVLGMAMSAVVGGVDQLKDSVLGVLIGIGLFFPFFIPRLVGAGDVKLFGAVGGFVGLDGIFPLFLYTLVAGGVLGVVGVLLARQSRQFYNNFRLFLIAVFYRVKGSEVALSDIATTSAVRLPYVVAIVAGTVIWMARHSSVVWS